MTADDWLPPVLARAYCQFIMEAIRSTICAFIGKPMEHKINAHIKRNQLVTKYCARQANSVGTLSSLTYVQAIIE